MTSADTSVQSMPLDTNPRRDKGGVSTMCTAQAMHFLFLQPWYRKVEVGLVGVLSLKQQG